MLLQQTNTSHLSPRYITKPRIYETKLARGPLLDRVYSLRYKSYRSEGYIEENASKMLVDSYDNKTNCASYLVYEGKKAIASIRICVYDPNKNTTIPSQELFRDEIERYVGFDVKFAEINKFVVDPSFQRKGGLRARFEVFNTMASEPIYNNLQYVVMAVRKDHVKFYKRLFDCVQISEEKLYPGLKFKTVLMLMKDIQKVREILNGKTAITNGKHEPILNCSNH